MTMAPERQDGFEGQPQSADVYAEPDGTVVLRFRVGARLTRELTAEVTRAHIAAANGQKRPILADLRGLASADRASRELAAGADVEAATLRLALLVDNPVTRVLGNFFLRVTTPGYPTQIFSDERQARAWLKEHPP
jgi:hypothetical protein